MDMMDPRAFAAMANDDQTVPVPSKDDWTTDRELRKIERQMVREQDDPAGFAAFAQAVLDIGITDPAIKAFVTLGGVINGLRRVKPCNKDTVRYLFNETRQAIDGLPDGPRKDRLDGLWDYNLGIFARENGQYDLAALSQERGATKAEKAGNAEGAAIGRFTAAVEWVNHALATGNGDLQQLLQRLRVERSALDRAIPPESNEYHWVTLNGPCHCIEAHFWANVPYDPLDADVHILRQLHKDEPELVQAHESSLAICAAINFLAKGDKAHASDLATGVINGHAGEVHPDMLATAHLLLARIATSEEARQHLQVIIDLPKEGAFQVQAIARRELVALGV